MRIRLDVYIEIKLKQSTQRVTITDDGPLDADHFLRVCLDLDFILLFVVYRQLCGVRSVLEDDLRVFVHHRHDEGVRVVIRYLVTVGVLAAIVVDGGQIVTLVGARSRNLHRVEEGEATRVLGRVGDEVINFLRFAHLDVLLEQGEHALSTDFRGPIRAGQFSDGSRVVLLLPEARIVVHVPRETEGEDVEVRVRRFLLQILQAS